MIIDYLKQMSDPSDPELHGAALRASRVDLESLRLGMQHQGVPEFLSEVAQACEAVGMLVLNATLSVGRGCAAATVGRRNIWLDAMGYDKKAEELFAECPTSGNQGLCGCTPEVLEKFKKEQTDHETVAKALASCKKPSAPSSSGAGRGRGSYAQSNSAKLQSLWAKGVPGSGRGGKKGWQGQQKGKQQPPGQQAATGTSTATESPAATKKAKK